MTNQNFDISTAPNNEGGLSINPETQKLLRETADKLQYSNFIGRQWEDAICGPTLLQLSQDAEQARYHLNLSDNHEIGAVIALDGDPNVKKQAGSLKIPDTVLVEVDSTDPSCVILRSVDFKFNLNVAQYRQVSPRTLSELLVQSPAARDAIELAIDNLKSAGKLVGDFKVAESPITDTTQNEFLPLDAYKKIRGYTGRFISPDTEENRSYFASGGNIRPENVLTKQLNSVEIDSLLAGAPGQDLATLVDSIPTGSMSPLDRRLLLAKVQATMTAKGLTSVELFKQFLERPQDFPDPNVPLKEDISATPKFGKEFGSTLRKNLPVVLSALRETVGQEKGERLASVTEMLNSFSLPPDKLRQITEYLENNL